jgi:hypothetical protein
VAALAAGIYFALEVHSTKTFFGTDVAVSYERPIIGQESISFAFKKPGTYVVTSVPSLDAKNADQTPAPFIVTVEKEPQFRVIQQKAIPQPLVITIVSSSAGFEVHQFP